MVNVDDFIKRLELILDYYSLSASGFADKIDVQRSSLSHLLSGRNKPSLDFILKIIAVFPEVDLYWILNGKGNFPKLEITANAQLGEKIIAPTPNIEMKNLDNLFSENLNSNVENKIEIDQNKMLESNPTSINNNMSKILTIEKIVIFYTNGTFSEYCPK